MVIPIHNDADRLPNLLRSLRRHPELEVLVVDYDSTDEPSAVVETELVVRATRLGRGFQIAEGVARSTRDWIWILHADCEINVSTLEALREALKTCDWGRFDVRLAGESWTLQLVEWLMNLRSAWTGICTGDQGVFVKRSVLQRAGGVPAQMLMEDIELARRLRRISRPKRIRTRISASARKWEREGVFRTIVRMWWFRLLYFFGVDATTLYKKYYG